MASSQPPPTFPQSYLDEYIGYRLRNTAIVFILIETLFVGLRVWARRFTRSPIGWDDYLVPLGLLTSIGTSITGLLAVKYGGVGHHLQAVPPEVRLYSVKTCFIAAPILYSITAALPKLAILATYLKIFVDKFSRICCHITGLIIILTAIANVLDTIFQCIPMSYLWDKSDPNGHCINLELHYRYGSLPNILRVPRKVKLGLAVTFLTGSIGLITSILRFVAFFQSEVDGTWAAVPLIIWIIVEPGIYLLAACLLAYRPLVSYVIYESLLSKLFSRSRKSSRTDNLKGPRIELQSNDGHSDKKSLVLTHGCSSTNSENISQQRDLEYGS